MEQITVNSAAGHYAVVYGRGVLAHAGATVSGLAEHTGVFVLSSPRVWKHVGGTMQKSLQEHGGAREILFNDAETAKNIRTVEKLCRSLSRAGADRRCLLVAVGGGVVGDVAGFVAASYLRGVRIVQIPTTLVAQVDSAIGGKTGVNLPEGKNLVGAFHPPRLVIADPETLRTLPDREFRAGLYEVIKYGVIADGELFGLLEQSLEKLGVRDPATMDIVLPRCIRAKAEIVSDDERESGLREILNFGHTFAHALESATRYRRFLHGEAVGWGMIAASRLAVAMNLLPETDAARVVRMVLRVGGLPGLPQMQAQRLLVRMRSDKKARGGKLRFILPRRIGQAEAIDNAPEAAVLKVLAELRTATVE